MILWSAVILAALARIFVLLPLHVLIGVLRVVEKELTEAINDIAELSKITS